MIKTKIVLIMPFDGQPAVILGYNGCNVISHLGSICRRSHFCVITNAEIESRAVNLVPMSIAVVLQTNNTKWTAAKKILFEWWRRNWSRCRWIVWHRITSASAHARLASAITLWTAHFGTLGLVIQDEVNRVGFVNIWKRLYDLIPSLHSKMFSIYLCFFACFDRSARRE